MPFDAKRIEVVPELKPPGPVRIPVPADVYRAIDSVLERPWRKSEFWNENDDVMRAIGRNYCVTALTYRQREQVVDDYTETGWMCRLFQSEKRESDWASIQFIPKAAHEAAKRGKAHG